MKKLLTMLTLVLTLTCCFSLTTYAKGSFVIGDSGGADEGSEDLTGKDGFTGAKSGYIIYASDANGNATSDIVVFTWDGSTPYSTSGCPMTTILTTRFGQTATRTEWGAKAPWGFPPFSGEHGTGLAIKAWLESPQEGYEKGHEYLMKNFLGWSDDQIFAWYDDPNNRFNVEPFMYGGVYVGSTHSGIVLCGSTTVWAQLTDMSNWGGNYSHGHLPNSMYHNEQVYANLPVPPSVFGKNDSGTILSHAYGIITVKPLNDKQIVKVYKTSGVVDRTSYSSGGSPVFVKDEGDYKVVKWNTSKDKTKTKSTTADYPEVTAGCRLVQSGGGPATVELPAEEKAIFILLEREKEVAPVVLNQESIRAHELNYLFRYSDGLRDEFNGKNGRFEGSNFRFNDVKHLYEKIPSDTIKDYKIDEEYTVTEEYGGGSAESGRPVHYYKSDDLELYHEWGKSDTKFTHDDIVNPHYSVNVSRVWWEDNLHTVEYRDSGMNGYVADVLGITPSLIGEETSANPGSNVENTLPEVQTNTYKYTAKLNHEWYERTKSVNNGVTTYGSWQHIEEEINHFIVEYTMNTYCDKYKVMVTPQASIASAGTFLEEHKSGTILGHDAITVQIEATQLGGTLTVRRHIVGGVNCTLISGLLPPRLHSHVGDRRLWAEQPHIVVALFERQ
ncbi:MAG: hypothetical protein IJX63_06420, partial [Lachnospiraceae bacterium]|nr:hypothetical protein [Lachnospiraceae bacterium]